MYPKGRKLCKLTKIFCKAVDDYGNDKLFEILVGVILVYPIRLL